MDIKKSAKAGQMVLSLPTLGHVGLFNHMPERLQSHGQRPRSDTPICSEVLSDEDATAGRGAEDTDPKK